MNQKYKPLSFNYVPNLLGEVTLKRQLEREWQKTTLKKLKTDFQSGEGGNLQGQRKALSTNKDGGSDRGKRMPGIFCHCHGLSYSERQQTELVIQPCFH